MTFSRQLFSQSSNLNVRLGSEYYFGILLMLKSSSWLNFQNGLDSRGMQVRYYLLRMYKYFNMEVR